MYERKAITATSATATTQLLDDHALDAVVAGMDCSTAAKLQNAYYAAGAAMRAAG